MSFSDIIEANVEWFKRLSADLECTSLSAPLIEFKSYELLTLVRGPRCLYRLLRHWTVLTCRLRGIQELTV